MLRLVCFGRSPRLFSAIRSDAKLLATGYVKHLLGIYTMVSKSVNVFHQFAHVTLYYRWSNRAVASTCPLLHCSC
jgi:hypothetical protein